MTLFEDAVGNTPLSAEESIGLLPSLSTRDELNQWERENILKAGVWANGLALKPLELLTEGFIRTLHSRMFEDTWKWAGQYRKTEKNIGVPVPEICDKIAILLGDVRFWIVKTTYEPNEIAVRFHHRLVWIHPFPNGNGRCSRLIADLLIQALGKETFSWGTRDLNKLGEARVTYLAALRLADEGNIQPLLAFARS
jgi:Fic-DOC domain mobile mystery protein B